jgi:hypothetical protein
VAKIRDGVAALPNTLPADDPSVADDLRFLDEWERGEAHGLSAILRMRQLRRAQFAQAADSAAPSDHAAP